MMKIIKKKPSVIKWCKDLEQKGWTIIKIDDPTDFKEWLEAVGIEDFKAFNDYFYAFKKMEDIVVIKLRYG